MLFSPLRVVLFGALGGGLIYGGVRAAGGGLNTRELVSKHDKAHSSHSGVCKSDICDHYVSCGTNAAHIECGHKCVELTYYLPYLTEEEKKVTDPSTAGRIYHDSHQKCPAQSTDKDFYRETHGSYAPCKNVQ